MIGERFLFVAGTVASLEAAGDRARAAIADAGLRLIIERADLLCASDSMSIQTGGSPADCVIIGDIFANEWTGGGPANLSPSDLAECSRSGGATLIDTHWGSYVALIAGNSAMPMSVVRAPMGRIAVYYLQEDGILYAASDVDLLRRASRWRSAINWQMIQWHLMADQLRLPDTGLVDVTELLPGFRLDGPPWRTEMLWDPSRYAPHGEKSDDDLPRRLRQIADSCIAAWVRRYPRIVMGVSGGLDSSIVAASAGGQGATLSCLTLATADPAGDERDYARQLTEYLGIHLFEFLEDPTEINLRISDAAHLPRPVARAFGQSGDRRNLELARETQADAFFSGAGGDNTFCYLRTVAPLADRLRAEGLGRGSVRTALDISSLTGAGLWEILWRGFRRARTPNVPYRWPVEGGFLAAGLVTSSFPVHPWLQAGAHLPPGKVGHLVLLLNIQNHLDGYGREKELPFVAPLLSQPLVEFCLAVPSWVWLQGGVNRALARQAYEGALPASILTRRSKGTPDPFIIEIFETNRAIIRDMLLGGALATQGLLDTASIEKATRDDRPVQDLAYWRLLKLVDVEAWARSWGA